MFFVNLRVAMLIQLNKIHLKILFLLINSKIIKNMVRYVRSRLKLDIFEMYVYNINTFQSKVGL